MKKILTIISIIPIITFASLNIQKVTSTLSNINSDKKISFFNANKKIPLKGKVKFTQRLAAADIILFSQKKHKSKLTIVDSYKKMKINKNSIGAIYLKKGRTQIVFVKERLSKHGLVLNPKLKKHIVHEWQLTPKFLMSKLK